MKSGEWTGQCTIQDRFAIVQKPILDCCDVRTILGCGRNKAYAVMETCRIRYHGNIPDCQGAIRASSFWEYLGTTRETEARTLSLLMGMEVQR